jgi:hypothetical protein
VAAGTATLPAARLAALVESAPPGVLAASFALLGVAARRGLLKAVPGARAVLNQLGVDLRVAMEDVPYSPAQAALGAIRGAGFAGDAAAAGAGVAPRAGSQQLPQWPGAAPELVDVFGYEELPRAALDALLAALRPLEAAGADLARLLAAAAGEAQPGAGEAGAMGGVSSDDVAALREAAETYSTLIWAYDKVEWKGRGRWGRSGPDLGAHAFKGARRQPVKGACRAALGPLGLCSVAPVAAATEHSPAWMSGLKSPRPHIHPIPPQVLSEQEADLAEDDEPPPPPAAAQRRMMRILRELDPQGGGGGWGGGGGGPGGRAGGGGGGGGREWVRAQAEPGAALARHQERRGRRA